MVMNDVLIFFLNGNCYSVEDIEKLEDKLSEKTGRCCIVLDSTFKDVRVIKGVEI